MCGICGIIDYESNLSEIEQLTRKMCEKMKHRGPDDHGIFTARAKPDVALGHSRLSIIDLSTAGHQPMSNEDKSIWVVLNGEIYNYLELKADLEKKGHSFSSLTDTETIIHLYEEYGEECVKYLRGMFAFAIWDIKNQRLLLARDRIGKKPLLYFHKGGKFCFASEFRAILASSLIDRQINPDALDYYFTFGYIPAPLSIYQNIHKLAPAHLLVLEKNRVSIKKYWELDYRNKLVISEQEAIEEILRILREAVKMRLYSDVPLGAFLSGGIDSSIVVALMSEFSTQPVKTFSIGFQEADYSELAFAKSIAERFSTEHHEFIVKPNALEIIPLLVERYGEPFADSSCVPTYYVARETRKFVTVALNGDGGDESFAGYERYQAMYLAQSYQGLPKIPKRIVDALFSRLPDSVNPKDNLRRIRRFISAARLPANERYLRWVGIFDDQLKDAAYTEEFRKKLTSDCQKWLNGFLDNKPTLSLLDRLLYTDTQTYLAYDLLVKMDIATMANSLEARSPFLDHKLMEFAAKLPTEYKMKNLVKKYILKKVAEKLIPRKNIHRKKMGFAVPVGTWFRKELKELLLDLTLSQQSFSSGYLKKDKVFELVQQHIGGKKDYSFQLWSLLMLEMWQRKFID